MGDLQSILNTVDQFYTNAYNQLLIYTIGLLAFLGALVPAVLSYVSNRFLKKENEKLKSSAAKEMSEMQNALEQRIDEKLKEKEQAYLDSMENKLSETKESLEKLSNRTYGSVLHLQANQTLTDSRYLESYMSAILSATYYIAAQDEKNMQSVLMTANASVGKLTKKHFEDQTELEIVFNKLIDALSKINMNERYNHLIEEIKQKLTDAKKRSD